MTQLVWRWRIGIGIKKTKNIVWYDRKDYVFSNKQGKWENIGKNLKEVKRNLNIPTTTKRVSWDVKRFVTLGGPKKGAFGIVNINNTANFSFALKLTNNKYGLVSGQTEIAGVSLSATFSSYTYAPGIFIYDVAGNFGIANWNSDYQFNSTRFYKLGHSILNKHGDAVAARRASLFIPLNKFSHLTNNYSTRPKFHIQMRTTANYKSQYDQSKRVFTTFKSFMLK